jgi:hypothetical protein
VTRELGVADLKTALDPVQALFEPVDSQRLTSKITMNSRNSRFQRGQPTLNVGHVLGQAVRLAVDLSQKGKHQVIGILSHRRNVKPP